MSGVALKSHGDTVQSAGVDSAESDEDNLRQRLHVAAHFGRPGQFGVATCSHTQSQKGIYIAPITKLDSSAEDVKITLKLKLCFSSHRACTICYQTDEKRQ